MSIEEIKPFEKKVWLASPTMHGEEQKYVQDAFDKNWITTAGEKLYGMPAVGHGTLEGKYVIAV